MPTPTNPLDDLLSIGGSLLETLMTDRKAWRQRVKNKVDPLLTKVGLVSREEFDVALAMISKARQTQEEIKTRLSKIEAMLKLSSARSVKATLKPNLPSVKYRNRKNKKA